jgi:Flp pilus assembly protein TadG
MIVRRLTAILRSLISDERGNVLAMTAVGVPLLLGCAGLAVDTIQWVSTKRELQSAADSAAIAGVYGLIQTGEMEMAVDRSLARDKSLDPRRAVLAERSPLPLQDDPFAVRVSISSPTKMFFSSIFLDRPPTITVEATASVVENGEFCAFAIGADDKSGLRIEPSSTIEMDCGIAANSPSSKAVLADGSAKIQAEQIVSFGGIDAQGSGTTRVRSYAVKQKDPLAQRDPPLVPSSGCPNVTVNADAARTNSGRVVLQPGCYGNMLIDGPVFLMDGEYILNRGNLVVGGSADLACRSCTIFLTSEQAGTDPWSIGKVQIDAKARVKLSAPTQGPNAGLLIFQDRRAAGTRDEIENVISGNSFSEYKGLIYFPAQILRVDAESTPDIQCGRFVGRRLIFQGRVLIAKSCSSAMVMNFKGTSVRLVG